MSSRTSRSPRARIGAVSLALALAASAAGCGRAGGGDTATPDRPKIGVKGDTGSAADLGFPALATKNTTRVAGADPIADAAAATQIVYPGGAAGSHPGAVTLVDSANWQAALAASVLDAPPLHAPTLFVNGRSIPAATAKALTALAPTGAKAAAGAQVIRVGTAARPAKLRPTDIKGGSPAAVAKAIDAFATAARGKASRRVLVVTSEDPAYAAPAAAWAATSGDPILFTGKSHVPPETISAIRAHDKPKIYVLGPSTVVTPEVTKELKGLGKIIRLGGQDPISNAVGFATYSDGDFGWGATTPGHGLVLVPRTADPATAAAVAPLSASGTYGPLLLLSAPDALDKTVGGYLKDIQPGYDMNAARGFFNHAWLVGDTKAITAGLQAEVDHNLETLPIATKNAG